MKQFFKVFKFEIKGYLTNKVFIGVTVFLMAAIILTLFFPRISESFAERAASDADSLPVMFVACENKEYEAAIKESFTAAFTDYEVVSVNRDTVDLQKEIKDEKAECGFVLNSLTDYTYYVNDLAMYDTNTVVADEVLKSVYQFNAMMNNGISAEKVNDIMNIQINHNSVTLGKDQMQNLFYAYIMIFALYMVILIYGQMVATNVASEKSSRAMELLITSVKPESMIFGKVVASCLSGLIQLVAVFGTAFVFYNFNSSYFKDNEIVASIFNIPAEIFVYMLLFFLFGFFLYAFLYGAIGSTASKLEDINTSVMPVTFLFIIAFMIDVFFSCIRQCGQLADENMLLYSIYIACGYVYKNNDEQCFSNRNYYFIGNFYSFCYSCWSSFSQNIPRRCSSLRFKAKDKYLNKSNQKILKKEAHRASFYVCYFCILTSINSFL